MPAPRKAAPSEADLREISVWSRRYAQNRSVPVLVSLLLFTVVFGAIGGSSYLVGWSYLAGHRALVAPAVALLALALALWIWSMTPASAHFIRRISDRAYRGEGEATLSAGGPPRRLDRAVAVAFGVSIGVSVALGVAGIIPLRYMQPVSALYSVPFLLYLCRRQRRMIGPLAYLWPILYATHAVLLLLGAPIYFSGPLQTLNMLVPTIGYGLLAALAGHLYSRFALRKLRRLAAAGPEEGEEQA